MAAKKRKLKKSAENALKSIIVAVVMAAILILAYHHVVNSEKTAAANQDVEISEAENVLLRDMDTDYPPSPKEVVKYYSDLTKCLYNGGCTDEQIEALAKRSLELFDDELAANQQWDQYLTNLKSEIATKSAQEYAIMSYTVSASTDVTYFEKDGYDCASLYCSYSIRNGSTPGSVKELFILRQDTEGHWKIFGWDLPEDENGNEQ